MRWILPIIVYILVLSNGYAACNCGSVDQANPCTGQSISVTVLADTPNFGTAVDNVYSWAFNSGGGDARCGQFSNGDYWVAPASGQSTVTITGISSSSHASWIRADANPTLELMGLLTGTVAYGNYSATENIIPNLPISYSGIDSIVAAIQRNEAVDGVCGTQNIEGQCIDSYHVVTVLPTVPENAGSTVIRPNITGETKVMLTYSDFDFTRLPVYSFLTGTDAAGLARMKKRWSHSTEMFALFSVNDNNGYSEGGRAFRSHVLIDDYGAGMASTWYNDMLILFSDDHTTAEKMPILSAMLTYGLDLYKCRYDPPAGYSRYWGTGATQHPGRFAPTAFLAALMVDQTYANNLKLVAGHSKDHFSMGPPEFAQIHDGPNGSVYGDIPNLTGKYFQGAYWNDLLNSKCWDGHPGTCNEALGAKTMFDPYLYIDGPPNYPGTSYFYTSLGVDRSLAAIGILMPQIGAIINFTPLYDFVFRVADHGVLAAPDPCVTPDSREDLVNCDAYRNTGCLYYGTTWGPVDVNDPASACITTPTESYNKQGRFELRDGAPANGGYTTAQIESNWTTIRSMYIANISKSADLNGVGSVLLNGAGSLTIQ